MDWINVTDHTSWFLNGEICTGNSSSNKSSVKTRQDIDVTTKLFTSGSYPRPFLCGLRWWDKYYLLFSRLDDHSALQIYSLANLLNTRDILDIPKPEYLWRWIYIRAGKILKVRHWFGPVNASVRKTRTLPVADSCLTMGRLRLLLPESLAWLLKHVMLLRLPYNVLESRFGSSEGIWH